MPGKGAWERFSEEQSGLWAGLWSNIEEENDETEGAPGDYMKDFQKVEAGGFCSGYRENGSPGLQHMEKRRKTRCKAPAMGKRMD